MRTVAIATILVAAIPLSLVSCSKRESPGTEVSQETPTPPAAEPTITETPSAEVGRPGGCEGTWAMVMGTVVLEPGGTGRMEGALASPDGAPVTWREEDGRVVVSVGGQELTGELSEDGSSMVLSPAEGPGALAWIRVDPQVSDQIAKATEANAPAIEESREKAQQAACLSNLKQLGLALLMYSADYDEKYPRVGASWEDVTSPYVRNEELYRCPGDPEPPSYQLNTSLPGHGQADVKNPAWFVMLFESDDGKAVAYRHNHGADYGFSDGHTKWLKQGAEKGGKYLWDLR